MAEPLIIRHSGRPEVSLRARQNPVAPSVGTWYLRGMLRVRNVTFKSADAERLADFWAEALGLPERRSTEEEVLLADADWGYPRFTFQKVDDATAGSGSLHLDLTAESRVNAVARLIALGAEEQATHGDDSFRWTVMRDPDGNEFCVTE